MEGAPHFILFFLQNFTATIKTLITPAKLLEPGFPGIAGFQSAGLGRWLIRFTSPVMNPLYEGRAPRGSFILSKSKPRANTSLLEEAWTF